MVTLEKINFNKARKPKMIIDQDYQPLIECKPRMADPFYVPPENKRIRPKWEFKMGVFKAFIKDDDVKEE